jgi:hypothetical protein
MIREGIFGPHPVEVLGELGSGAEPGCLEVSQETQEGAGCGSVVPTVVPTPPVAVSPRRLYGGTSVFPMGKREYRVTSGNIRYHTNRWAAKSRVL